MIGCVCYVRHVSCGLARASWHEWECNVGFDARANSVVFTNSEQCRGHRLNQRRHTAHHDLVL